MKTASEGMSLFSGIFFQEFFSSREWRNAENISEAKSFLGPATPEVEIERAKADCHAVVFVALTEPAKHSAREEDTPGDTPKPYHSEDCGRLNAPLHDSQRLGYIPEQWRSDEGHRTTQGEVRHDHTRYSAQETRP
jgi:hypothetical protein